MPPKYLIWLEAVDPARCESDTWSRDHLWIADEPAASDTMAASNDARIARLRAVLPGLAVAGDRTDTLEDVLEDDVPAEVMIRRFHRIRVATGPWEGGTIEVILFDDTAQLSIGVAPGRTPADLGRALEGLLDAFTRTTGLHPMLPATTRLAPPAEIVAALMVRHGKPYARFGSQQRREALLVALGLPSVVILTALAWAAAPMIVFLAIRVGTEMAAADPDRPMRFVTQAVPPPGVFLGVFPDFMLDGQVVETGEPVRLPVYRDQALRAGPGAPFTVLPTTLPASPYVLKARYDQNQPLLRLGPVAMTWVGALAVVPMGLWGALVGRPWWKTPPERRDALRRRTSRMLLGLAQIAGLMVAVALARMWL